jgi:formate dehydrogenase subunit gamma
MMKKFKGNERILHHKLPTRLFHWCLVLSFLPAGFTGLILFFRPLGDAGMNLAMQVHIVGGMVLFIACALFFLLCPGRVISFWREITTWTDDDYAWMKISGGYIHKFLLLEYEVPPMNKLNSGQKMMGVMVLVGTILLILTGLVLYIALPLVPKEIAFYADRIHLVVGIFLFMCVVGGHIPLGIYNWPEFCSMFGDGTINAQHAQEHHPLWTKHEIKETKK